jgi:SanA protein
VFKIKIKMILNICFGILLLGVLTLFLSRIILANLSKNQIYTAQNSPTSKVAIVFGAGLKRDGSPTAVLQDRVSTASKLYFNGNVQKILMSGDNRFLDYNEPGAMLEYAIKLGVPEKDIVMDYAGIRTYDTCYRAIHIFGVKDALLITQQFHLPRALYLCRMIGMQTNGVVADLHNYSRGAYSFWQIRESVASAGAIWDIWIGHPVPVMGKPEPIFKNDPPSQ